MKLLTEKEITKTTTERMSSIKLLAEEWNNLCDKCEEEQKGGSLFYTPIRMGFSTAIIYGDTEFYHLYKDEIHNCRKIKLEEEEA